MTDNTTFRPETKEQVLDAVHWALDQEQPLNVFAQGSKKHYGGLVDTTHRLDLSKLKGIDLYEPAELFLSAKAGTPMHEIEALLEKNNQQLYFEPINMAHLLGDKYNPAKSPGTIGGVISCNLSGPRRVQNGAARDHILGFNAVSGQATLFKSGGRVIKNVTGFDMSKLMAGSFGTLAVMTDLTVKVMPIAEKTRTVLVFGASDEQGRELMSRALGSSFEVSAASHLPATLSAHSSVSHVGQSGVSVTAIRVEGPGPSVEARCNSLKELLSKPLAVEELHTKNSRTLWREIRDVALLPANADRSIWRVSVAPTDGPTLVAELTGRAGLTLDHLYDWGGGLVWLSLPGASADHGKTIRDAVQTLGGHATVVRASDLDKATIDAFHQPSPPISALQNRIKQAFDPKGILNPGRMPGLV